MEIYLKNAGGVWFGAALEEGKVTATSFCNGGQERVVQNLQESLGHSLPSQADLASSPFAQKVLAVLQDIYEGKDALSGFVLAMEHLPVYTQRVLRAVLRIPVGYVASYGGVADAAGGGARAVGNVMAANPFAPLVPCHRVVSSSLGLGGYGGGLKVKYEFLKRERRGFAEPKAVSAESGVLRVFPVEFVLGKLERTVAWKSL